MAGHEHHLAGQVAQRNGLTFLKEVVELRAVVLEARLQVEHVLEYALHLGDVGTNADLSTELASQVGCGREVVGVGMGLQNPLRLQAVGAHVVDHLVGTSVVGTARLRVVVEHRIDDRAVAARAAVNDVGHRPGGWIEHAMHLRLCGVGRGGHH